MTFGPLDNAKRSTWIAIGIGVLVLAVILWIALS